MKALYLAAAAAASIQLAGLPAAQAAEIEWRMQTYAGLSDSEYKTLVQNFANRVETASGGRMKIDVFPAGQLVPTPGVIDAVRAGALEIGHTFLVYFSGKEPGLSGINEWPIGFDPLQGSGWFYEGGGMELVEPIVAEYGLHMLGVTPVLAENMWLTKPVASVDDLKSVKIRSSGLTADAFASLGAAVVSLPVEDVYNSLQRGVIDGAEFTTIPVHYGFGWHEVAKYVVQPAFSKGSYADWIVNEKAWAALPNDLKDIVDNAVREAGAEYFEAAKAEEAELIEKMKAAGVTFIEWSDDDMRKIEAARVAVVKEKYIPKSAKVGDILDSRMEYLGKLGYKGAD